MSTGKKAILLGSSGLVGGLVLDEMLSSSQWSKVYVVVRKPLKEEGSSTKLHEIVIPDLTTIPENEELAKIEHVDAAIITLGVSESWGWTVQELQDVEVKLSKLFADHCHAKYNVPYISVLSAGTGMENSLAQFTDDELQKKISV